MTFSVIGLSFWERKMGYLGQSGLHGQVTVIEAGGVRAYVRENIRMDTFMMSSNERLGVVGGGNRGKNRGNVPPHAQHVLELACPKEAWASIADLVKRADAKHRAVVQSDRWTVPKALHLLTINPLRSV